MTEPDFKQIISKGTEFPSEDFTQKVLQSIENEQSLAKNFHFKTPLILVIGSLLLAFGFIFIQLPQSLFFKFNIPLSQFFIVPIAAVFLFLVLYQINELMVLKSRLKMLH